MTSRRFSVPADLAAPVVQLLGEPVIYVGYDGGTTAHDDEFPAAPAAGLRIVTPGEMIVVEVGRRGDVNANSTSPS